MDAIHGVTLDAMAEIQSKHNELRAQHGEPAFKPHFHRFLSEKGIDENTWAHAWNSWMTRMDADKSGQLWAKFHQIESALSTKAHFGDVADMSQENRGGLTLEQYAKISAEMGQPGADQNAVLAANGVSLDTYHAGSKAWNDAMAADTMHKITTQYGALYAKYNPAHQAAMQAAMGQAIANRGASSDVEDDDEEYTFEKAMEELRSKKPRTRWTAAHLLAQKIQTELSDDAAKKQQAMQCVPVLIECLERHDKETVSNAEASARDLVELEQFTDDAKGAIERCLGRGREHLATVEAAFAPIQNKNVPERVYLQSEIQDYTSLVETLEEIVGEWDDNAASARASADDGGSHHVDVPSAGAMPDSAATGASTSAGGTGIPIIDKILSFFR